MDIRTGHQEIRNRKIKGKSPIFTRHGGSPSHILQVLHDYLITTQDFAICSYFK